MWPRNDWTSRKRPHPRQTSRPELDMRSHLSTSFDGNGYFVCCFPAKVLNVGATNDKVHGLLAYRGGLQQNQVQEGRAERFDSIPAAGLAGERIIGSSSGIVCLLGILAKGELCPYY